MGLERGRQRDSIVPERIEKMLDTSSLNPRWRAGEVLTAEPEVIPRRDFDRHLVRWLCFYFASI